MDDHALAASRTPPEHVNRTTRHGADHYVLACNARRDADEITFHTLERLEQENRRLRSEVKWKLEHASTRTANWVRSRVIMLGCVLAGLAALTGWMFTPNGRVGRVAFVQRFYASSEAPAYTWSRTHLITSDMTQHEIDSEHRARDVMSRVVTMIGDIPNVDILTRAWNVLWSEAR